VSEIISPDTPRVSQSARSMPPSRGQRTAFSGMTICRTYRSYLHQRASCSRPHWCTAGRNRAARVGRGRPGRGRAQSAREQDRNEADPPEPAGAQDPESHGSSAFSGFSEAARIGGQTPRGSTTARRPTPCPSLLPMADYLRRDLATKPTSPAASSEPGPGSGTKLTSSGQRVTSSGSEMQPGSVSGSPRARSLSRPSPPRLTCSRLPDAMNAFPRDTHS
jgi:hypothetical protein